VGDTDFNKLKFANAELYGSHGKNYDS